MPKSDLKTKRPQEEAGFKTILNTLLPQALTTGKTETAYKIIQYLLDQNDAESTTVIKAALLNTSNLLHLTINHAIQKNNTRIITNIIHLLSQNLLPEESLVLLQQKDPQQSTPLHLALKTDNQNISRHFFELIRQVLPDENTLTTLLMVKNKAQETPFSLSIQSYNRSRMMAVLEPLINHAQKDALLHLFTQQSDYQPSPLFILLQQSDAGTITTVLQTLKNKLGADFSKLFLPKHQGSTTLLHLAIQHPIPEVSDIILNYLRTHLSPTELLQLFRERNIGWQKTPLEITIRLNQAQQFPTYFNLAKQALIKSDPSLEDETNLIKALTQTDPSGKSLLNIYDPIVQQKLSQLIGLKNSHEMPAYMHNKLGISIYQAYRNMHYNDFKEHIKGLSDVNHFSLWDRICLLCLGFFRLAFTTTYVKTNPDRCCCINSKQNGVAAYQ